MLMILRRPLARLMIGTGIGTAAAIAPLSIAAAPFVARAIESAFKEVDGGVIQAARHGATAMQSRINALLPEAMPALIAGITLTLMRPIR